MLLLYAASVSSGGAWAQNVGQPTPTATPAHSLGPSGPGRGNPNGPASNGTIGASVQLSNQGTAAAKTGDWRNAAVFYQQAITLWPENPFALYGLGESSARLGDIPTAVTYYRAAVYNPTTVPMTPTVRETQAYRLFEYAQLLSRNGEQEEAVTVYNLAATRLNYQDGKQHLEVLLPEFGTGPGQVEFTPKLLQAMADVGWAADHSDFERAGAMARLQEAVTLAPDSPVPFFYRGRHEARYGSDYKAAGADFDRALRLGGLDVAAAVQREKGVFGRKIDAATQTSGARGAE